MNEDDPGRDITGRIEPVRISLAYRLLVVLVTACTVLLPVIYLGLIGGGAWLVWWWATEGGSAAVRGTGSTYGKAFLYIAPLVVGGTLVLFLVKPMIARRATRSDPVRLPQSEQRLVAFVHRICDAVGAPYPREIHLDAQVNASASLSRGPLSRDLTLTIGLPLVAGTTRQQFGGILAHEFGHFGQGSSMRLTWLVHGIVNWFIRVAHERDAWDERLRQLSGIDIRVAWIFWLMRLMTWVSRLVLKLLAIVARMISCALLRQMEFAADLHEIRFAGSQAFIESSRALRTLGVAQMGAMEDLSQAWADGRLGDDLPALILDNVDQIPAEGLQRFLSESEQQPTGLGDTHPADRDRIAQARQEANDGIYRSDQPASDLFHDFAGLCRMVTLAHYRQVLGLRVRRDQLVDSRAVAAAGRQRVEESRCLQRFSRGTASALQPLDLPPSLPDAPDDPAAVIAGIRELHRAAAQEPELAQALGAGYREAHQQMLALTGARELVQAKLKAPPQQYGLARFGRDEVEQALKRSRGQLEQLEGQLQGRRGEVERRLVASLSLLHFAKVRTAFEDPGATVAEASALLRFLAEIRSATAAADKLLLRHQKLIVLLEHLDQRRDDEVFIRQVRGRLKNLQDGLGEFLAAVGRIDYPFDHSSGQIELGRHLLPAGLPRRDDLPALIGAFDGAISRFHQAIDRAQGRLAWIAERVEGAIGLKAQAPSSAAAALAAAG